MKIFAPILSLSIFLILASLQAEVVRPAPNFTWESFNGSSKSLSSLGKQPVILIIAPSPKSGAFKKQLARIEKLYRQYAERETLFVAAFTTEPGAVASDIPFLYAANPQQVAADYGLADQKFEIVIIGPDRNLDLISNSVTSGERLRDVIDNSYTRQAIRRK